MGADNANGTALRVTGRSKFSTAGTAVVASGQKKVTVTLAGVTPTEFVLATVQAPVPSTSRTPWLARDSSLSRSTRRQPHLRR
jgi:hypothetical protein